jgi:hypothetical protein
VSANAGEAAGCLPVALSPAWLHSTLGDNGMFRYFLKYSAAGFMVQILVCTPYYWEWHFGPGMTPDWLQHIGVQATYFYLPVAYLLALAFKPFIGEGENAARCLWLFAPIVGTVLYSLIFGALQCWARSFRQKRRPENVA